MSIKTTKGQTAVSAEPTNSFVFGCPVPTAFFTLSGVTAVSGTLVADAFYLLQAPDYEFHFKLHEEGAAPGTLYTRVQANTDFPLPVPKSEYTAPAITVSGTTGSTGVVVVNRMVR